MSFFYLRQDCHTVEQSVCQVGVVFVRVNHVGNHTCVDEDIQCNHFDCFGSAVVSAVFHSLNTIFQQGFCAAAAQSYTSLFGQCQFVFFASCGEFNFDFFTHTVADTSPQEGCRCFCDNLCGNEDVYGGSVYTEECTEYMVRIIVDTQCGVTCACGSDCRECEVRFFQVVSNQFTCIDCFTAAQAEDHVCVLYNILLLQFFCIFECRFTGEQNIFDAEICACDCFIQIFFCSVDGNFITDYNCFFAVRAANSCDFFVSVFASAITREKYRIVIHFHSPPV